MDIPLALPKPDLTALTGGYRRTPVLQIAADIYCDTALIAQVLEDLQPAPSLFAAWAPLAGPLAQWADSALFWSAVPYAGQPAGVQAGVGRWQRVSIERHDSRAGTVHVHFPRIGFQILKEKTA